MKKSTIAAGITLAVTLVATAVLGIVASNQHGAAESARATTADVRADLKKDRADLKTALSTLENRESDLSTAEAQLESCAPLADISTALLDTAYALNLAMESATEDDYDSALDYQDDASTELAAVDASLESAGFEDLPTLIESCENAGDEI